MREIKAAITRYKSRTRTVAVIPFLIFVFLVIKFVGLCTITAIKNAMRNGANIEKQYFRNKYAKPNTMA